MADLVQSLQCTAWSVAFHEGLARSTGRRQQVAAT
jgi:hypothetical protein